MESFDEILDMASTPEKINSDTAQRVIISIVRDTHDTLKHTQGKVDDIDDRLKHNEEFVKENPPLLWLLRFKTKETVGTIAFIFGVLSILQQSFDSLFQILVGWM